MPYTLKAVPCILIWFKTYELIADSRPLKANNALTIGFRGHGTHQYSMV